MFNEPDHKAGPNLRVGNEDHLQASAPPMHGVRFPPASSSTHSLPRSLVATEGSNDSGWSPHLHVSPSCSWLVLPSLAYCSLYSQPPQRRRCSCMRCGSGCVT